MFHDEKPMHGNYEYLLVSRTELEKKRMRKKTDHGTDVGIELAPGKGLHDGDILSGGEKTIIIKQIPEKVITVKFRDGKDEYLVLAGHIIGNMHRPVSAKHGMVSFPIQADSELDVFERLFSAIQDAELSVREEVFTPQAGADVHEHHR